MIYEPKPTQSTFKLPRKLSSKLKNRRKYYLSIPSRFYCIVQKLLFNEKNMHERERNAPMRKKTKLSREKLNKSCLFFEKKIGETK